MDFQNKLIKAIHNGAVIHIGVEGANFSFQM